MSLAGLSPKNNNSDLYEELQGVNWLAENTVTDEKKEIKPTETSKEEEQLESKLERTWQYSDFKKQEENDQNLGKFANLTSRLQDYSDVDLNSLRQTILDESQRQTKFQENIKLFVPLP